MSNNLKRLTALFEDQSDLVTSISDECLTITTDDGIEVYMVDGESQLVVETLLFAESDVTDIAALNSLILKTHQLVPLASIGTKQISGATYYIAFGALSTGSQDQVIAEEVEALVASVPEFLELYAPFLVKG